MLHSKLTAFAIGLATMLFFSPVNELKAQQDSILNNVQDFNCLTAFTEANYSAFPFIMKKGYRAKYRKLKDSILSKLQQGQLSISQATCEYAYWFHHNFDGHYYVDLHMFWHTYMRNDGPDYSQIMVYQPEKLSVQVDKHTWLIRIPSCEGKDPTFQWVNNACKQYLQSKCRNLIVDIRGNSGGSDEIWNPLTNLLIDHQNVSPEQYLFRNTYPNSSVFENHPIQELPDWAKTLLEKTKNCKDDLIKIFDENDDNTDTLPAHNKNSRIAFIIDHKTASAAETILRIAKKYTLRNRYLIFGKENSAGCAETGNIMPYTLPHSRLVVYYPTTVSSAFLSEDSTYGHSSGIRPNVHIDLPYPGMLTNNIDEWVKWVARYLEH